MLKEAALLTLDITELAARSGFTIVDAPADNVTFQGTEAVFIDLGSFRPGEMEQWSAYGQFCDNFLAPLMLEAYRGVPFQRYLGDHGLSILDLERMLSFSDIRRKGVLTHVKARAVLERRAQRMTVESRRALRADARPGPAGVARMVGNLRELIKRLTSAASTEWAGYESVYTDDGATPETKEEFVRAAAASSERIGWAYDVGANAGRFSRILAEYFPTVLAIERDPGAVEELVAACRPSRVIHPAVIDITAPTPSRGLMLTERRSLIDRAPATFATFLAVIHHLSIGGNIPLAKTVELMRWVAPEIVVEFVEPEDARVQQITAARPLAARGYTKDAFEAALLSAFEVVAQRRVSETRLLYHAVSR